METNDLMAKMEATINREIASIKLSIELEKERATKIIAGEYGETFVGSNLASSAIDLAKLRGRLEACEGMLRTIKMGVF